MIGDFLLTDFNDAAERLHNQCLRQTVVLSSSSSTATAVSESHKENCTCIGHTADEIANEWFNDEQKKNTKTNNTNQFKNTTSMLGATQDHHVQHKIGPKSIADGKVFSVASLLSNALAMLVPSLGYVATASVSSITNDPNPALKCSLQLTTISIHLTNKVDLQSDGLTKRSGTSTQSIFVA